MSGQSQSLVYEFVARTNPNKFGDRVILYAATDSKEHLNRFFDIHKRECFIVVKRDEASSEELEKLRKWKIVYEPVYCMTVIGGKVRNLTAPMCLSYHEYEEISESLELVDSASYNVYVLIKESAINNKIFSKGIRKCMKELGLLKFLKSVVKLYGDQGEENDFPFGETGINEWYLLKQTFGDVLIGGDDVENPYI